ncbi:MAG TPA: hypothetical protein DIW47_14070 [Bacteroidetes bacterium]|nr:hypothetical protein [Bacteroidota bacterium]
MKNILLLLMILTSGAAFSQDTAYFSVAILKEQAIDSAQEYMSRFFSENDFTHHVKLQKQKTQLFLLPEYKKRKLDSVPMHWVEGYHVTYAFETAFYSTTLTIVIRGNFKVYEHIDYIEKVNLQALFYQAHSDYLKRIQEGKLIHADSVYQFVKQQNPDKEWGKAEISRTSFPPYRFYYRVFESNCNPCEEILIELDELKEIERNSHTMISD